MERKMKDSGIPWIGEIPEEWQIHQLRGLSKGFRKGSGITKEDLDPEGDILCVRYGDLYTKYNKHIYNVYNHTKISKIQSPVYAEYGDILFTCSGEDVSCIGKSVAFISSKDCLIGGDIIIMKHAQNPRFLGYSLDSDMAQKQKSCGRSKLKVVHISVKDLKNVTIPIPPLLEQEKIANFLDQKCSEIDELIEVEQKMIDELEAYRQAIITETVTRGLNPEVTMRSTNIPWAQEIPEHWEISRVGMHFNLILGKMLCSKPLDGSFTNEPYFCAANIHFRDIDKSTLKKMWFSPTEKNMYEVKAGDLLIVEGGAGAGGCCVIENIDDKIYIQNSIIIARSSSFSLTRYLAFLIESFVKEGYIEVACNKATFFHYTKEKVANTPFIIPPREEQQAIADFLDTKCKEIDDLITVKREKIETLKQYRQSLIFEAVTGKIQIN